MEYYPTSVPPYPELEGPSTYHVYDHATQGLVLLGSEVLEDVTALFRYQLEGHSQVVVLKHRLVIVHQGQLRTYDQQVVA